MNLGLPSGLLWAPVNLDVTQPNGFAADVFGVGCSFVSWGNTDGHNVTTGISFLPYNFGSINAESPWYEGQPYGETPGCLIQSDLTLSDDIAHAVLGSNWHIPSDQDFAELFANCVFIDADGNDLDPSVVDKRITVDGVRGIYLKSSINGAKLFFPCSGYADGSTLLLKNREGRYWSTKFQNDRVAVRLLISESQINYDSVSYRHNGLSIRPVLNVT